MAQLAKIYPGCQSNVFYIGSALLLSLSGSCYKRYLLLEAMGDRGEGCKESGMGCQQYLAAKTRSKSVHALRDFQPRLASITYLEWKLSLTL